MKKTFLFILAALLSVPALFAHDQVDQLPKKEYRNWSFMIKGGITRNGYAHFPDNAITSNKDGVFTGMYGVEIERTITQLWGMSIDANIYNFNGAFTIPSAANAGLDAYNLYVQGDAIETALLGSINLSNLLAPKRSEAWRKFNVYFRTGAGLTFYRSNRDSVMGDFWKTRGIATATDRDIDYPMNYKKTSIVVPAELQAEWNFCKPLALGLIVGYRWHSSDHFGFPNIPQIVDSNGGIVHQQPALDNNVDFFTAQLSLRWKIRSTGSNNHIRNFTPEMIQDATLVKAYNDAPILDRLDAIEGRLGDIDGRLADAEQALRNHDQIMATLRDRPEDLFQNPGDILIIPIVEFDTDSYKIRANASEDLDILAQALATQPTNFTIMVSGHTDSRASVAHNDLLSQNRANAVKAYLLDKGVRQPIIATGFGKRMPIAPNDTPENMQRNRRVEIRFAGR